MRRCPICSMNGEEIFKGKILKKYAVSYYKCPTCAFIYTERPYWISEAYSDSISKYDTGIMQRNVTNVLKVNMLLCLCFKEGKTFIDWGGGYGIFTRMMRDIGYNWFWYDKYSENLVARGFECDESENGIRGVSLITAFELFEHFENPREEITKLLDISKNILFTTEIYSEGVEHKEFDDWWYYAPETGQHISFYSQLTLEYLAQNKGLNYYKIDNGTHLFTEKRLSPMKLRLLRSKKSKYIQLYLYDKKRREGLAIKDKEELMKSERSF